MLLISDTNILMDLDACNLTEQVFKLPCEIAMADAVLFSELSRETTRLLEVGLKVVHTAEEDFETAIVLHRQYPPGFNDCLALSLASRNQCPLLTGDSELRALAIQQGVEVLGTIWLVCELIQASLIDCETARRAMIQMKHAGRRLPWTLFAQEIEQLC